MDALRASDAILFGMNQVLEWREKFEAEWNAPDMKLVDIAWQNIPEEIKGIMRIIAPPELLEIVEGGENGKQYS